MSTGGEGALYAKRIPIHPRSVRGRFRRLKHAVLALAYGVYFLLPWLRWERPAGPDQAVLFDLPARRFYVFGLVVHPDDIFWLAGVLVAAALLLFFVTSLAGRVFCGYFCFQTLWTDVYQLIERLVQGERAARLRLEAQPWDAEKIRKKGLTHLLWLAVAFATGLTFTLYWADAPQLVRDFFTGAAPFPAYATAAFLTATTYVMAGIAREQVCTYMCPYARFQGVMFDRDTLIVAYDRARGEGRKGRHRPVRGLRTRAERHAAGHGDCVDCGYCVQVCPTGIDIRDGLQYQCITCALCIDACDTVMDRLGWPRGLIRYTSENALAGRPTRLLRPKVLGYGGAFFLSVALLAWSVAARAPLEVTVIQQRQPLYVTLSDGRVQNGYELKLVNKTERALELAVRLAAPAGAELDLGRIRTVRLAPERMVRVLARVRQRPEAAARTVRFRVEERAGRVPAVEREAPFFVPQAAGGG